MGQQRDRSRNKSPVRASGEEAVSSLSRSNEQKSSNSKKNLSLSPAVNTTPSAEPRSTTRSLSPYRRSNHGNNNITKTSPVSWGRTRKQSRPQSSLNSESLHSKARSVSPMHKRKRNNAKVDGDV